MLKCFDRIRSRLKHQVLFLSQVILLMFWPAQKLPYTCTWILLLFLPFLFDFLFEVWLKPDLFWLLQALMQCGWAHIYKSLRLDRRFVYSLAEIGLFWPKLNLRELLVLHREIVVPLLLLLLFSSASLSKYKTFDSRHYARLFFLNNAISGTFVVWMESL